MAGYSKYLINQLKVHEGLRLKRYKDTKGHWTIGYGHNMEARPFSFNGIVNPPRITAVQATILLAEDIDSTYEMLSTKCSVFRGISDGPRKEACVNMAFQMGVNGFMRFRKMRAAISEKDWPGARLEMVDSEWHRLYTRRAMELEKQMLTGEYEAKYM